MIHITTLGGLSVNADGRDVTPLLGGPRHRALLAYLAIEREAQRDMLATLLWPRLAGGRARRELSRAIHELTRVLGHHWVTAQDGSLRVAGAVEVDALTFEAAVQRNAFAEALALHHGPFLPDLRADRQPLLESWLGTRRLHVQTLYDRARHADVTADRVAAAPSQTAAGPHVAGHAAGAAGNQPRLLRLLGELQRRHVFRVAAAYGVSAFVISQVAQILVEALGPPWLMRVIVIVLLLGFPVAVVLAWVFELTDTGELRWEEPGGWPPALLWVSRSPWRLAGIGVVTLGVIGIGAWGALRWPAGWGDPHAALDDDRYVVLPFERTGDVRSEFDETQSLYDALSRWGGIVVVDLFQVRDALGTRDGVLSPQDARNVAVSLGAGRFTRGTVGRSGSLLRIYAALHDTRSGDVLADTTVQYTGAAALADSIYAGIAGALLFRGAGVRDVAIGNVPGTRSFPARLAFERGREALQGWDLENADAQFALAMEADPDYARAALLRAQVQNWSGRPLDEVRVYAERAAAGREQLTLREGLLADAIVLLARGLYREACDTYTTLRDINERDFAAWYGLGECHRNDDVVVADASSPSGWAFRSSYHQAIEAYYRAFTLLPSFHRGFSSPTFERVRVLLYMSTTRVRRGRSLPPDTSAFLARPGLVTDTFAFVPYLLADFATGSPGTAPALHSAAIDRQRRIFHEIATAWVIAFPESPDALEALAVAQELLGDTRALTTLREARGRSENPSDRVRMASREVTLLVKFGVPDQPDNLFRAVALADTVLHQASALDSENATALGVVAALTGRVFQAAERVRQSAGTDPLRIPIPPSITAPAAVLRAYAALGGPADSVAAYEAVLDGAIRNRLPLDEQPAARHYLLDLTASLAFSWAPLRQTAELGAESPYPVLRAQAALSARDTIRTGRILREIRDQRRDVRPAEQMLDAIFPEAWLWDRLNEPGMAAAVLDSTLEQLRWTEPAGLAHAYRAAALIQSLILRAELAAASGDLATAVRWARPVVILWARADEPLEESVARMRAIIENAPRVTSASATSPSLPAQVPRRY